MSSAPLTAQQKKNLRDGRAKRLRTVYSLGVGPKVPEKDEHMRVDIWREGLDPKTGERERDNELEVVLGKDGHISICDDPWTGMVYLYPEQVVALVRLGREAVRMARLRKRAER